MSVALSTEVHNHYFMCFYTVNRLHCAVGTAIIQFMFTRPLSCKVNVVLVMFDCSLFVERSIGMPWRYRNDSVASYWT